MFERCGAHVLYADSLARTISDNDPIVKQAILRLLGSASYRTDGSLNREYVALQIFSDKQLQKKLNAILHPRVEQELMTRMEQLSARRVPFVFIEAALIYEAGLDKILDAVVVVDADEDVRVQRVVDRDGVEPQQVRKRMKAQWSQQKKLQRAEYVIRNNGSLRDLERRVKFLFNLFSQLYH